MCLPEVFHRAHAELRAPGRAAARTLNRMLGKAGICRTRIRWQVNTGGLQ